MQAYGPINTGVAAGGAGVATNNATGDAYLTGKLYGFYVRYNDSPPAGTTDITIAATGGVMPERTLLTITNAATDGFFPVRLSAVSTAAAAITDSNVYAPLVGDKIKVTIAQANNADSADVWVVLE